MLYCTLLAVNVFKGRQVESLDMGCSFDLIITSLVFPGPASCTVTYTCHTCGCEMLPHESNPVLHPLLFT